MIDNYRDLIPADFATDSRVWVYQSSRLFMMSEALHIEDLLNSFIANWNSHGAPVKGYGNLLFGQFVVLMADERATGVSGCSTDSSVRLIKQIEQLFNVNMFDRQMLAFMVKNKVQMLPLSQLQYAINNNFISPDTLYFNNLVQTKEELDSKWLIPVKDSWLAKRVTLSL
ncbi:MULTISPECIES: hypothetical protein [Niastella]|uniref:ABC transporter ATPase n=1 Tax=Niastella soli TaxID=2821487 RepID=A0ABS3YXL7_9BACT|nr:hypothetical protein [Niastella soli]MBO9202643.1 hypothetical protein [Niastella soli]